MTIQNSAGDHAMTSDNNPTVAQPELPGVANLEPPKDLFTAPEPEPEKKPSIEPVPESKNRPGPPQEDQVVTEVPPRPSLIADHADWRDVDDDPWQADEDAPPPVIGS